MSNTHSDSEPFVDRLSRAPILWIQTEEDALTSWRGLQGRPGIDVLAITSGGCTPLTFLALGAKSVIAVDVNFAQTMVLDLKRAAFECLDYDELLSLLGIGDISANASLFERVRRKLPAGAREYWDENTDSFATRPFINCGGMQNVGPELRASDPQGYTALTQLFDCQSTAEQAAFFHTSIAGSVDWQVARFRQDRAERFFGAREAGGVEDQAIAEAMCRRFVTQFRQAAESHLLAASPWACHMLLGNYRSTSLPLYLMPDQFQYVGSHLDRLQSHTAEISSVLAQMRDNSLDGMDISNICDLLSRQEWECLSEQAIRVLRPGGRLVRRNLVMETPHPTPGCFTRDEVVGFSLTQQDQSIVYLSIIVEISNK